MGIPSTLRRLKTTGGAEDHEDQGSMGDSGPYRDPRLYEDLEFFDDSGKTRELIKYVKFLDFHIIHMFNLVEFTKKCRFIYHC